MKVLFVSSGNNPTNRMAPFIESQGESLVKKGVDLDYYLLDGHGIKGYLRHVIPLRRHIRENNIDIIHAHYSLCALIALLTFTGKSIVSSYMGSDAYGAIGADGKARPSSYWMILTSLLLQPFLSYIVCKSESIKKYVFKRRSAIIPNGVDFDVFQPSKAKERDEDVFKILFLGNPADERKNYPLLKDAVELLADDRIEILAPYPVPAQDIPAYYAQADMLALCSLQEGSPNVVKEAMACNLPIVATNAGDAWWLLGDIEGHYKAGFDPDDFAKGIKTIMQNRKPTRGRDRLTELGLNSRVIAGKLIRIYITLLKER